MEPPPRNQPAHTNTHNTTIYIYYFWAAAPAADPGVYTYVPQLECSRPHFLVRDELRVCFLDNFTG